MSLIDRAALLFFVGSLCMVSACAQAKPGTAETPQKEREGVRTLQREPPAKVEVDERFFEPFLLSDGAPESLREGYGAFVAGQPKKAAERFSAFLDTSPDHAQAQRVAFLLAHLEARNGDHASAAARFSEVASRYELLADHAYYYGAKAALRAGDHPGVLRLCKEIGTASPFGPRARHLRAQAMRASGQKEAAAGLLEALSADFPKASFAGRVKLELALTYEDLGRYAEAGRLYHEVEVRYPGRSLEKEAVAGVRRLRPKLSRKQRQELLSDTPKDRFLRASALNGRHKSDLVVEEMKALLADEDSGLKKGDGLWCDAANLQGVALRKLRKHNEAAEAYALFLGSCPAGDRYVKALYSAARSLWTVDRDEEAFGYFEQIWDGYPSHSYADDAVLYAAKIRLGQGKTKAARRLLDLQVDRFPRGDMLGRAHWLRFKRLYDAGDHRAAVKYVDEVGDNTGENDIYSRGRLHYFRARALEDLDKKERAVEGYAEVVRRTPMSFYALMAFNRLALVDEKVHKDLLVKIAARETSQQRWSIEPPQLVEDSRFKRGVELLRLGLFPDARMEFDRLRRGQAGHERMLWTLTLLFDRAGAYHLSHNIPRREIGTFGTSYPVGADLDMFLLAYPQPYLGSVQRWAKKRGLPEALVYAIMREESGFNPKIESWANAYGLMQLILPTAKNAAEADDLKRPRPKRLKGRHLLKPELNIRLGTRFLSMLFESYDKHPAVTIAGYNGGFGNVDRWLKARGDIPLDMWIETIPFGQTRNYTKRVLSSFWSYQWLYGDSASGSLEDKLIHLPMKLPPASTE